MEAFARVLEGFSWSTLLGTVIFGAMIGALYRWRIGQDGTFLLWVVGLGFIIVTGIASPVLERIPLRVILWTALCISLVAGRIFRLRVEEWRLRRKHRKYAEGP